MQQHTYSAGGVVLGADGRILVVNQNGDSWSLPKGFIDPGEDARTAAEREIQEESGITKLQYIKKLGTYDRYRIGLGGQGEDKTNLKSITMFLFKTKQTHLSPEDPENPQAKWVDVEEVAKFLTHPKDRAFFRTTLPELLELDG